jgi:hypothetical protein
MLADGDHKIPYPVKAARPGPARPEHADGDHKISWAGAARPLGKQLFNPIGDGASEFGPGPGGIRGLFECDTRNPNSNAAQQFTSLPVTAPSATVPSPGPGSGPGFSDCQCPRWAYTCIVGVMFGGQAASAVTQRS